ncbi:MAG: FHA domain-containing protein, partial [Actinobacteria bacterium]|nr:FHA domain-containing protein [Actinomycetota bacterium]
PAAASGPTTADADLDQQVDDEDSATVSITAFRAARAAAEAAAYGPTVQAVHCPAGHPNPAQAEQCRICGEPIIDHSITIIARPIIGVLLFDDGTVEPVDQPLILGRRPRADQSIGDEPARTITLADPDKLLSRVHAEIQLADWQVRVVDRESMNHTFVQIPGQAMFQLRPGEPYPIPLGTRIAFGDVTSCRYSLPPLDRP